MKSTLYIILLYAAVALTAGCTEKQAEGEANVEVVVAQANREQGLLFDLDGKLRLAELHYKKAFETLKDNPAQDWFTYSDAGYRYAWLLCQRGDTDGALATCGYLLEKTEDNPDFPITQKSGLLSLMAQCQLHLAMPEAAKQTFAKVYQNQLSALGGSERGDFNLALMCGNIFMSFFENGEYAEAWEWLDRYEREILAWEKHAGIDVSQAEMHHGLIDLYKAQCLLATGHPKEAADVYAAIPHSRLDNPQCIGGAISYLMSAGRYAEAADKYAYLDTIIPCDDSLRHTFDIIATRLAPRYIADMKAGRTEEALTIGADICASIDSALVLQKKSDAAELAVIYQTHEKELAMEESETRSTIYLILAIGLTIILVLIASLLLRAHKYNRVLAAKNRSLYMQIQEREKTEEEERQRLQTQPEESLTSEQQLFRRICTLMTEQHPYTDENLNRDMLAQMLGTNAKYVVQSIRECSHGETVGDFITSYRLEHVARLLKTTNEPIALVGEMSGIPSRATLARLFRNAYGMSCSDFRQTAQSER